MDEEVILDSVEQQIEMLGRMMQDGFFDVKTFSSTSDPQKQYETSMSSGSSFPRSAASAVPSSTMKTSVPVVASTPSEGGSEALQRMSSSDRELVEQLLAQRRNPSSQSAPSVQRKTETNALDAKTRVPDLERRRVDMSADNRDMLPRPTFSGNRVLSGRYVEEPMDESNAEDSILQMSRHAREVLDRPMEYQSSDARKESNSTGNFDDDIEEDDDRDPEIEYESSRDFHAGRFHYGLTRGVKRNGDEDSSNLEYGNDESLYAVDASIDQFEDGDSYEDFRRQQILLPSSARLHSTQDRRTGEREPIDHRPQSSRTSSHQSSSRQRASSASRDRTSSSSASSRGRSSSTQRSQEFQFSSSHLRQNKHSREAAERRVRENIDQSCTFRPTINKKSAAISSQHRGRGTSRFEQLARKRQEDQKRREILKAEEERKKLEECTFQPEINRGVPKSVRKAALEAQIERSASVTPPDRVLSPLSSRSSLSVLRSQVPLEERLHHEADRRAAVREQRKRLQEEIETQQYGFQPRINKNSEKLIDPREYRPVYMRVGELQKQKAEKLHRVRLEIEENDENLTFSPQINRSAVDDERMSRSSRLHRSGSFDDVLATVTEKKLRLKEEREREIQKQCTFTPRINPISDRIVQESDLFAGSNRDFLERQFVYERRKKHKNVESVDDDCTFHPKISKKSEVLVESKPYRLGETPEDTIERLASVDRHRTLALRESIAEQHFSQYSFRPEINRISRCIGRTSSLDELVKNERNKRIREEIAEQTQREIEAECTFRPKVEKENFLSRHGLPIASKRASSLDPKNSDKILEKIERERERKLKKIDEIKREREYQELQECTFEPQLVTTAKPVSTPSKPIIIKGFGKHLERQELSKKYQQEKKEREDKVFLANPQGNQQLFTRPEPFRFRSDIHSEERRQRLEADIRRKEQLTYTFHPQTNEGKRRQIIDRLLSNTSGFSEDYDDDDADDRNSP